MFNEVGAILAREGLFFFYHPHGFEFKPWHNGTLFDLLMQETNPKYVHFQMDVYWIAFPGQSPAGLLEKYKGRWISMHLKDMKKGVETGILTGKSPGSNDVALGTGQIDMVSVLRTAQKVGVRFYFIEDESPQALEQIPQSLRYLETVRW
jgi:sugar phosphate isomerase/epimerase